MDNIPDINNQETNYPNQGENNPVNPNGFLNNHKIPEDTTIYNEDKIPENNFKKKKRIKKYILIIFLLILVIISVIGIKFYTNIFPPLGWRKMTDSSTNISFYCPTDSDKSDKQPDESIPSNINIENTLEDAKKLRETSGIGYGCLKKSPKVVISIHIIKNPDYTRTLDVMSNFFISNYLKDNFEIKNKKNTTFKNNPSIEYEAIKKDGINYIMVEKFIQKKDTPTVIHAYCMYNTDDKGADNICQNFFIWIKI